ncbi:MAG: sulfatase-like hydrolase/transferase [Thermoleophilaceae bacterium]
MAAPPAEARRHPPVVLLVLDEFPTTDLLGKHRAIDARRFPNFARLARDAGWYRNATTVYDTTFSAVPAILEGRVHRYRPGGLRPPRNNILSLLAHHGYRVHASAEARNVCQRRFCGRLRSTRYYLVRSRLARLRKFIGSIKRTSRPTIWFKHVLLPHLPWIYLPSGKQYIRGFVPAIRGINSEEGVFDPTLERLSYQRHLLQVTAVDRELGKLLDRLKRTRMYDRTLLIVVADHGISFRVGERDKRVVTRANVQGIAPVPLFVKRPHQRRGRVSGVYARNSDVAPTIARVVGVHIPWATSGHSVWSRAVRGRHTIHVGSRLPHVNAIRISLGHFQARWTRLIRNTHGLFGIGSLARLFAIGPARRLIGRQLAGLRMARPGRYHASILRHSHIWHVKRHSRFVPALVSGYIRGGRGRHRRSLAIAVNGRIAATTRSFFLRGSSREGYAVIVPDHRFHPGRNHVRVLGLGRRGKRLRFRLLGRV